jgi:hypothetical protein
MPNEIRLARIGARGQLLILRSPKLHEETVKDFYEDSVPVPLLFEPQERIRDAVNWEELQEDENEFMRGIFYYADTGAKTRLQFAA